MLTRVGSRSSPSRCVRAHVVSSLFATVLLVAFQSAASAEAPPGKATPSAPPIDPKLTLELCVHPGEKRNQLENSRLSSEKIAFAGNFLTLGSPIELGIPKEYDAARRFHIALLKVGDSTVRYVVKPGSITSRKATETDDLVHNRLVAQGNTILQLKLLDDVRLTWQFTGLYVYQCVPNPADPTSKYYIPDGTMRAEVVPSSRFASIAIFIAALCLAYLLALRIAGRPGEFGSLLQLVSTEGRASLGKFQVLFFTLTVFALLAYIFLRTGVLSGLSDTVLGLLGIAGVGSTFARAIDSKSPGNSAASFWLNARALPRLPTEPQWQDLFSTDGEFDVFKYQSLLFSLLVAVYLIAVGVSQLATFEIHHSLLGVLGLSQVVYLGGKVAAQSNKAEVSKAVEQGKALEDNLRAAVIQKDPLFNGTVASAQVVAPLAYAQYEAQLREISAATGLNLTATLQQRKL